MQAIQIEVQASGRHVHLSEADFHAIFGEEQELINVEDMGAGMFRAEQRVTLKGPKGAYERVAILGPYRAQTQVEISLTDARTLGINPPIRMSGDLEGSEGCIIEGANGSVTLTSGVMIAKRHAHLTPEDANTLGVVTGDVALLYIAGDRALLFDEVMVRVDDKNDQSELHIDIDEINAAHLPKFSKGLLLNRRETNIDDLASCLQ